MSLLKMKTVIRGAAVCALCVIAGGIAYAQARSTDEAPSGWFRAGNNPTNYRTGVDYSATRDGVPSAYLASTTGGNGFGTLMQTIDAANYEGKRVRLRGWVKAEDAGDWAGLWMRVDQGQRMVAFDNMENRKITGTQPWSSCDVVLDVPADATSISFGILLAGTGKVWLNDVSLEVVGNDIPTTGQASVKRTLPMTPVNLKFKD